MLWQGTGAGFKSAGSNSREDLLHLFLRCHNISFCLKPACSEVLGC